VRYITLTTDFGASDWFVGTMKGVIYRIAPQTQVIDLTHEVPPGGIRSGAFALAAAYAFFPRKTIHVAIVDPGVGTNRRAIGVETSNYFFVGPDNGLLSWALAKETIKAVYSLDNAHYFLPQLSATFHGRDLFAPIAAHLSRRVPLGKMGRRVKEFNRLPWPEPTLTRHGISGEIVYVDHFGNGITNISSRMLDALIGRLDVFFRRRRVCSVVPFYQAVPLHCLLAVVGSSGFLEIAVNGASAAKVLRLDVGLSVEVRGNSGTLRGRGRNNDGKRSNS
jgi:S-adenosylmethionine hydrolase